MMMKIQMRKQENSKGHRSENKIYQYKKKGEGHKGRDNDD